MMPAVVVVLMVLAPTTKTPPSWSSFAVFNSMRVCNEAAPDQMKLWEGRPPVKWQCVTYRR